MLKSHAMAQSESANQELDSIHCSQQAETAKFTAMLKKVEVKTSSLEEMLGQKVKENEELTSICDELISKIGGSE
jgi:predicted nuclease with TOPRIM domain